MPTYLDVGVAQVQPWLTRSPDLKGLRGASSMLTTSTGEDWWSTHLPAGCRWNDQSGDIAGVVNLVVDGEREPREAAVEVIRRLRSALPMALLQGSWADASSYAAAYPALVGRDDPTTSITSRPAQPEMPLARTCQRCQQAMAGTTFYEVGDTDHPVHVCRECSARREAAGHGNAEPTALEDVWAQLIGQGSRRTIPLTMEHLARVGSTAAAHTRVAVFYADGNAVGAFIKQAMEVGITKASIAVAIDSATRDAFVKAARTAARDDRIGVIPHLVGGDDVLASVAAACVWDFALEFIGSFEASFEDQVRAWEADEQEAVERLDRPTMSAGIVFHHMKSPLNDAITQAARLLKQAKVSGPGARVCWSDQMNDSPLDPGVAPRSLAWIGDQHERVASLAREGQSHRKQLSQLARTDTTLDRVRVVLERQGTLGAAPQLLDDRPIESLADLLWVTQLAGDPPTHWPTGGER